MKKNDITLIAVVIIISAVFSLVLADFVIPSPSKQPQKVEVVEPISADFPEPDDKYFNNQSINPTKVIQIGDTPNQTPFNGN